METVGLTTRKHQDWFDDNNDRIQAQLEKKDHFHRTHLNDTASASKLAAFNSFRRIVPTELRQLQDAWLSQKTDEIQSYADRNGMKNFYSALKTIYGPTSSGSSPLVSANGNTLILDKGKILERWTEHFNSVLNRPFSINYEAISRLPQVPIDHTLADLPTESEKKLSGYPTAKLQDLTQSQRKSLVAYI